MKLDKIANPNLVPAASRFVASLPALGEETRNMLVLEIPDTDLETLKAAIDGTHYDDVEQLEANVYAFSANSWDDVEPLGGILPTPATNIFHFPNNMSLIPQEMFKDAFDNKTATISIPAQILYINQRAFQGCRFGMVVIQSSVQSLTLGADAFQPKSGYEGAGDFNLGRRTYLINAGAFQRRGTIHLVANQDVQGWPANAFLYCFDVRYTGASAAAPWGALRLNGKLV